MTTTENKKGFTIIEVVLVLAIAALIFLMVFVAYPALSRGQRDTQRKNDLSRASTAITNAMTNNRGRIPANVTDQNFIDSYLVAGGDSFTDPSGKPYNIQTGDETVPTSIDAVEDVDEVTIYFTDDSVCSDSVAGGIDTGKGDRKFALRIVLEGGGVACVSN